MTSRFCTLTSKFFSLEVMTSWKFRAIENPAPDTRHPIFLSCYCRRWIPTFYLVIRLNHIYVRLQSVMSTVAYQIPLILHRVNGRTCLRSGRLSGHYSGRRLMGSSTWRHGSGQMQPDWRNVLRHLLGHWVEGRAVRLFQRYNDFLPCSNFAVHVFIFALFASLRFVFFLVQLLRFFDFSVLRPIWLKIHIYTCFLIIFLF